MNIKNKQAINEIEYEKDNKIFKVSDLIVEKANGSIQLEQIKNYKKDSFCDVYFLINNCDFQDEIKVNSTGYAGNSLTGEKRISTIVFEKCIFKKSVNLSIENIDSDLIFHDCIFLDNVNLNDSVFTEYIDFSRSIFFKNINLINTTFDSKFCFKDVVLIDGYKFDLRETYINDKTDFLNISSKKLNNFSNYNDTINEIKESKENSFLFVENRETARIIKDSFEQQNNIIEANRFYALEMKEREKELEFKKEPFEWLVFKIHGLSSNHSQDWTLSLFWIIIFGLFCSFMSYDESYIFTEKDYLLNQLYLGIIIPLLCFTMLLSLLKFEKIKLILSILFISLIFYLNYTRDIYFNHFAYVLNPFSIMRGDEPITFGTLIFKIIIAYLIYQLIISIRQNTRRK